MISALRLKFSHTAGVPADAINITPITVFVGPNNSGKSKILQEINQYCHTGQVNTQSLLLDELIFSSNTAAEATQKIAGVTLTPYRSETLQEDHVYVGKKGERQQVSRPRLIDAVQNPEARPSLFCQWFLKYCTLMLNGKERMNLVAQQPAGDLQLASQNSLQVLFRDDQKRAEVRRIIADAFEMNFVVDPTHIGHLRVRLSSTPPSSPEIERGLTQASVDFHSQALLIDEASDGVKAFTGIITELIAGDPYVVLIDEPEAFLHPALASKLGNEISRAALNSDKKLFVSTHSPSFVMGCIQSGAPVNIVRLTYRNGIATARILPSDEILKLMRNPLLRSTGVLSGLFYESVVVTESDTDRAFYQEINERLLRFKPEWGIPNCLFINAQNKQTVPTIIRPLRNLGIPAVGLVDIDVIKDGGQAWTKILDSAFVPAIAQHSLASLRGSVKVAMDRTGRDMKKDGGVDVLSGGEREAACNLLEQLNEYGIFAVPTGEIESWLKSLLATGHGPAWLIQIFEKMGEDPSSSSFLKPTASDVWKFMSQIRDWIFDQNRKGIPSQLPPSAAEGETEAAATPARATG